ncbi:MAG TPA: alpha/beta fold hydrolase [Acidisarcina sp.]|nr:alpha/beta fold hydrolase [Acidisarcina sp.]
MTQKPSRSRNHSRQHPPPGWQDPLRQQQPLVSHRWLLRALGIALGLALVCAYLALCLLFYQGGWQLLFHPSHAGTATPANVGMRYEDIHFDATETGRLQLTGWWISAEPPARYDGAAMLYLHGAEGSLSDTLPQLRMLHALGINLFAIDYRGFGKSMAAHPSEQSVYEDADAAIEYLSDTRKLDTKRIVIYGEGLGATIAAEAARRHPLAAGLVLENPMPPALEQIAGDRRTGMLPVRMLFADRFELAPKLSTLATPKLFLQTQPDASSHTAQERLLSLYKVASEPKRLVPAQGTRYFEAMLRFLDDSLRKDSPAPPKPEAAAP